MRNKKEFNKSGFTLVETLVVSSIFIVISVLIIAILIIVLRGAKKSDSIILVRQNGEHAMAQMVRMMRFARSLDDACPFTNSSSVTITSFNDLQTTFSCPADPIPTPNFIASNSAALTNSGLVGVQACSFTCTRQGGGPPTVNISFTLSKINLDGLPEADTVIPFQSSVTFRNF